ncbi:MAG TPA: N-methyl-D-aspartate receptor NMDAR2C subunit [Burkholderiales bacterium]|nr:N-methyl-D-aspartate receptor NMDAR2C subunit [Burkholderiales bacterium]
MITPARWAALWQGFGLPAPMHAFYELAARYAETHRHYHTARHISECFTHFDGARDLCEHPSEVELALWFHDAVYQPRANDNEAKSADWAVRVMLEAGIDMQAQERVRALVMATCHNALPDTQDAKVLVDVDLAILGANAARFDEYEVQVRAEYGWVPEFLFRRTRKKILKDFLARPSIYSTEHCKNQFEKKARDNLARSLLKLNAG